MFVVVVLLLSAAPLRVATADIFAQKIWQCFTPDALLIVGNLIRPFNVLDCTLEGNQLSRAAIQ